MSDIKNIQNDYSAKLKNNLSLEEINQIKTELFGKNGLISSQFKILDLYQRQIEKNLHQILIKLRMSYKI